MAGDVSPAGQRGLPIDRGGQLTHTGVGWGYALSAVETRNRVGDDDKVQLGHDTNPGCFRRVRSKQFGAPPDSANAYVMVWVSVPPRLPHGSASEAISYVLGAAWVVGRGSEIKNATLGYQNGAIVSVW